MDKEMLIEQLWNVWNRDLGYERTTQELGKVLEQHFDGTLKRLGFYHQGYDEAVALLEQFTKDKRAGIQTYDVDDYGLEAHVMCVYCGEVEVVVEDINHAPDCPIAQTRKWLHRMEPAKDAK